MIERRHQEDGTSSHAVYSDCERYRYSLTRSWDTAGMRVGFVMLNPSKATELQNDPTVERCERRARHLGYGAFQVTNIFAWRDTDPMRMRAAPQPVGPENDDILTEASRWADHLIAAWGVHGAHMGRGPEVARTLQQQPVTLFHLGLTKDGHPRHPLYLPYAQRPLLWKAPPVTP